MVFMFYCSKNRIIDYLYSLINWIGSRICLYNVRTHPVLVYRSGTRAPTHMVLSLSIRYLCYYLYDTNILDIVLMFSSDTRVFADQMHMFMFTRVHVFTVHLCSFDTENNDPTPVFI